MVSIDNLYEVVHGLFKEPIIGPLKSKMADIRHLENRHDVIFFCRWWSDLDKISQTIAGHVDCGDMVEIETRSKIPIWRPFGRIQGHVIPQPPATLQGAATWRIQCHDSSATCHITGYSHLAKSMSRSYHITGCKNSIRHMENRYSPIFFCFLNAVWALTSGGFRIVFDTLVLVLLHFPFIVFIVTKVFIARQHIDVRYLYSNSVCSSACSSVCPSVRPSVCRLSLAFRYFETA